MFIKGFVEKVKNSFKKMEAVASKQNRDIKVNWQKFSLKVLQCIKALTKVCQSQILQKFLLKVLQRKIII